MVTGFFGMSVKFAEVTLAFRHRTEDQEYCNICSILCIIRSWWKCSVSNQPNGFNIIWLFKLVIIRGIKRIARVSSALVPIMSLTYICSCLVIIGFNIHNLGHTFKILFSNMIDFNTVGGGMVGVFVAGIQRAIFASEAGIGSAAITHATTKGEEPVRTGLVAMIEPCFDTMLICCLTGITIVITGAYQTIVGESRVISFVYCCEVGCLYLFGAKSIMIYRIAVIIVAFFSGLSKDIMAIANIGGTLFSYLALINMTALILFSNQINDEVQCYLKRLRNNKIN
ncbi:Na(+)-linked D-alanine glycine permease-like [Calliopsis andreniformis]|uniref:Na(+)-linked D-alanine glycine permease-like n=1 Tax=Calliopsis andreniformis TaxID=337506 RepID=UPI003FCE27DE